MANKITSPDPSYGTDADWKKSTASINRFANGVTDSKLVNFFRAGESVLTT